ncbi:MAG: fumarylacetoacetate hydrolase family protein [Pseudomonadota bacterium]
MVDPVGASSAERLAARLWQARAARRLIAMSGFPAPPDLAEAYALQSSVTRASGARVVGWKVGAGDPALQERFGLPGPFVGPLLEGLVHDSGAVLTPMPGAALECELTLRIGRDFAAGEGADDAMLLAVVDAVVPSFEVIGRRFEDEPDGQGARLVGDGGINVEAVMGRPVPFDVAAGWPGITAALSADGAVVAEGTPEGAGLMPPAVLLRWLLDQPPVAERGLRAGDLIMTGTLTGVLPLSPGMKVAADFGVLGVVEASIGPAI